MEKKFEQELACLLDIVRQFSETFPDAGICFLSVKENDTGTAHCTYLNASQIQIAQMVLDMVEGSPKLGEPISQAISAVLQEYYQE